MSADESKEVPVDVLPPLAKESARPISHAAPNAPPFSGLRTFYHPASGVVILALDWFAFGSDLVSDFLALPVVCVLAFLATFPVLYVIQRKWSLDTKPSALGKAFLGAFLVGLPFPITGTLLGAAVLALAGLPGNPVEALKKITTPQSSHPDGRQ
jgi:hypothetical protein